MGQRKTTSKKAELHEVVTPLLKAIYLEFKELSRKKPDATVSKDKIKIVNRLLTKCKEILHDELSVEYLDLLDEDNVPQTSDVVIMLSQYVAAMDSFHGTYFGWKGSEETWFIGK